MPKGKRKFVVEVTETSGLSGEELSRALSRLSARLSRGTASIERGFVVGDDNHAIGNYRWVDQMVIPPPSTGRTS